MMPKGVEHKTHQNSTNPLRRVKIPMMPKGVEHTESRSCVPTSWKVKIPMMPKGVEHELVRRPERIHRSCEDSNDAERR